MEIIKKRLNSSDFTTQSPKIQPLKVLLIASQPLLDDDANHNLPLHLPDLKEVRTKIMQIFKDSSTYVELIIVNEATFTDLALALKQTWDIIHYTGTPISRLIKSNRFKVMLTKMEAFCWKTDSQKHIV